MKAYEVDSGLYAGSIKQIMDPYDPEPQTKDSTMPYVNIQVTAGLRREDKEALVREITDTIVRVLGKKPEHTHIVIQEIAEENWGFAGVLTDTFRASEIAGTS